MKKQLKLTAFIGAASLVLLHLISCGGGGSGGGVAYTLVYTDPVSGGGDVTLMTDTIDGNDAFLDIVLNNIADVWGIKFFLAYTGLDFRSATAYTTSGTGLADANCNGTCILKESSEGTNQVLVSVTRSGDPATVGGATVTTAVVRLYFKVIGPAGNVGFAFSGTEIKDPDGVDIVVDWLVDDTATVEAQ